MTNYAELVYWGYPTMVHFFLATMGGGALTTSTILLMYGGSAGSYFSVARYAAFIAPVVIFDDAIVLIAELGRPSRFLNIFKHINFESPLWLGSWLMAIFLFISLTYAYTFLTLPKREGWRRRLLLRFRVAERVDPGDRRSRLRWTMAIIGLPLGIAVCHYPGLMMSGLVSKPLWSTNLLPTVTLLSGMATALAAIVLCRVLFRRITGPANEYEYQENNYRLTFASLMFLIAEAFVLLQILVYARNTSSSLQHVLEQVIMEGGLLAREFWLGAVLIGFVIPIIAGTVLVTPRLIFSRDYAYPRPLEAIMPAAILVGSCALIYVLLFGGQLTSPVGI